MYHLGRKKTKKSEKINNIIIKISQDLEKARLFLIVENKAYYMYSYGFTISVENQAKKRVWSARWTLLPWEQNRETP